MIRELMMTVGVWIGLAAASFPQETDIESRYLKALELCRTNNQARHAVLVDFDLSTIEFDQPVPMFGKLERFAVHAPGDVGRTTDTRIYMDKRPAPEEAAVNLPTNLGVKQGPEAIECLTFVGQHGNRWFLGTWAQGIPSNVQDWTDRTSGDAELEKYLKKELDRYKFEAMALPFLDMPTISAKCCTIDRVLTVQKLKKVAYSSETDAELTIAFLAGGEAIDRFVLSAKHNYLPIKHEFFLRKRSDEKLTPQSDHGKLTTRTKTHWESQRYKDPAGKDVERWVPTRFEMERFGGRYVNVEALCAWDYSLDPKAINSAAIIGTKDHSLQLVYEKLREQIDKRVADSIKTKKSHVNSK